MFSLPIDLGVHGRSTATPWLKRLHRQIGTLDVDELIAANAMVHHLEITAEFNAEFSADYVAFLWYDDDTLHHFLRDLFLIGG